MLISVKETLLRHSMPHIRDLAQAIEQKREQQPTSAPLDYMAYRVYSREPVVAVYADGGVVNKNPSPLGGTWAWCAADAKGQLVAEAAGFVPAPTGYAVTNNQMEQLALVLAIEGLPDGWRGSVCTDSQVALYRTFLDWRTAGLPKGFILRYKRTVRRLGICCLVLLKGHPTKADLARGATEDGRLVSEHNAYCDKRCNDMKELLMDALAEAGETPEVSKDDWLRDLGYIQSVRRRVEASRFSPVLIEDWRAVYPEDDTLVKVRSRIKDHSLTVTLDRQSAMLIFRERLYLPPRVGEEFYGVEFTYASGEQVCADCGCLYVNHPADEAYPPLRILCSGAVVKL